jgi:cysteine desulfurase
VKAYLDHASTTPLAPEALASMLPFLTEHFGNPSSANAPGRRARLALDEAHEQVAQDLGCAPGEVVFCSGGTEASNLAVQGTMRAAFEAARTDRGVTGSTIPPVPVCTAVEHPAVLRSVKDFGGVTVSVGADGVVDPDDLAATLERMRVPLVAVMLANNEVGTVQPVAEMAAITRELAPDALFFVDAVHAVSWIDVADACATADMVAISAHKFGGPKGAGALVIRNGGKLHGEETRRWLAPGRGGPQERERRPGTEDVAGIVGMGAALRATTARRAGAVARIGLLRDRLADGILSAVSRSTETGVRLGEDGRPDRRKKVAGSCHLLIDGVEQEELLFLLDSEGVFASAGSACASGASEPSHVLEAMGLGHGQKEFATLRLSLGHETTVLEVDHAVAVIPKIVEHLRAS